MQVGSVSSAVHTAVSSIPSTIRVLASTLAQSTQLSLSEKQDFMQLLEKAAGNPALLKKILLMIAQLEALRKPGTYPASTIEQVLNEPSPTASTKEGLYA